jgi:UDP-3-O-[3-hydroxymyristoyl] glucosamine N-acyltransferase
MHHAVINAGARVGNNCIINSKALIEHDVAIDDHCHIATGAIINGGSSVGSSSFIGSGSEIRESIAIGNHCLIGMGVSIRNDLPPNTRVAGN